jgi:hypothetical protein
MSRFLRFWVVGNLCHLGDQPKKRPFCQLAARWRSMCVNVQKEKVLIDARYRPIQEIIECYETDLFLCNTTLMQSI